MNLEQSFQLFEREYPSWKTYSEELLRQALIEFCIKHNIRTTSNFAEFLHGYLRSHIPIPPLKQNRRYTYKPPEQHLPRNQSHKGIPQTHQGSIPSPTDDPLQSQQPQSITDLNQSLQKFMQQTEEHTSSQNLLSQFQKQKSPQGLGLQGLGQQGLGTQNLMPQSQMQQY